MRTVAVSVACVVVIIVGPFPSPAKVLALVVVGAALLMALADEVRTARAQVAAARYEAARADEFVVAWFRDLRVHMDEDQADWERWLGSAPGFDSPPLGSVTPLPLRPRVLRSVPKRRGGAS